MATLPPDLAFYADKGLSESVQRGETQRKREHYRRGSRQGRRLQWNQPLDALGKMNEATPLQSMSIPDAEKGQRLAVEGMTGIYNCDRLWCCRRLLNRGTNLVEISVAP
jgi:hypothetical protein